MLSRLNWLQQTMKKSQVKDSINFLVIIDITTRKRDIISFAVSEIFIFCP